MAQKRLYALFDKQINSYLNPLVFTTDGEAIRWFTTIVNQRNDNNSIYSHFQDYSLHMLGTLDDQTGEFTGPSRRLIEGIAVKETEQQYTLEDLFAKLQERSN